MIEFARTEFKIYRVIGKYERNRDDDLCVKLGNFYTGQFECEGYESNLKLGEIIDLIEVGDAIKYKELRHFSNYETNFNKEYIVGIHDKNELKNMKEEVKNNKIKILQIYTKEQLESIGYKVREE